VDLVVIVEASSVPLNRRAIDFDTSMLPVPADVLVYTAEEWNRLTEGGREALGPVEWIIAWPGSGQPNA
jgi:hypothetical protein